MKTLTALLLLAASAFAQTAPTVTITITIDGVATVNTMTPSAVSALAAFIADQKLEDGKTPKYSDIADLLSRHVFASLVIPMIQRYNPAVLAATAQAAQAEKAAQLAAAQAAGAVK